MRKTIFICDRCGGEYEPAFHVHGDTVGVVSDKYRSRTLFEVRICERLYSNDAYIFRGKDLCNDCHQKLADWWRKGGKGND
jgi:hypothetical protein